MGKMKRETLERRMLSKRRIDENGCWIWTGRRQSTGYGTITDPRATGKRARVHRIAAWLWLGFDLESDLCICHSCDTAACFNPDHLFVGTHADNMRDMAEKNRARTRKGESSHLATLTEVEVLRLRAMRTEGSLLRELAVEFSITVTQVWNIVHRKQWRHVA